MRFILKLIFFLLLFFTTFTAVKAHPLDITITHIYINTDANRSVLGKGEVAGEIYVSWQETSYIYQKYLNKTFDKLDFDSLIKNFYKDISPLRSYISGNVALMSNGNECKLSKILFKDFDKSEILVGKGVGVSVLFDCGKEEIGTITFSNKMFLDDFSFQTHSVKIFSYNKLVKDGVLNKDNRSIEYALNRPAAIEGEVKTNAGFISRMFGFFENNIDKFSLPVALALFLVGFLHSLEAGHLKTVLFATAGTSKKDVKKMTKYVLVFVVSHVSDILLLSLLALAGKQYINSLLVGQNLFKISILALVVISGYQLFKNIYVIARKKKEHDHTHEHDTSDIAVAFLAGLAPCAMGWTIFMLILGRGIDPVNIFIYIVVFALGIATALMSLYFAANYFVKKLSKKFLQAGKYAPAFSYGLIFLYSLIQLFRI